MLHTLPTTFKPVLQHIRLSQVAGVLTSYWIKLRGSHTTHVTCCKTSLPWVGKMHNMYRFVKMKWSACHERGTKKKSESPRGFEPMTSQTPSERSIHLSYGELIDFVAKCRTPLYFLLQVFTTWINRISCKTGMDVGGTTHNSMV